LSNGVCQNGVLHKGVLSNGVCQNGILHKGVLQNVIGGNNRTFIHD
jgi:hypothetical protein